LLGGPLFWEDTTGAKRGKEPSENGPLELKGKRMIKNEKTKSCIAISK